MPSTLWLAGVDEERAPVAVREVLLEAAARAGGPARCLKAGTELRDAVLLAGCRQFKVFARGGEGELDRTLRWLDSLAGRSLRRLAAVARGADAARDVFRAQAGLAAWLPGGWTAAARAQAAYREAYLAGTVGAWSHRVFQRGLHVAKRIRERLGVEGGVRCAGEAAAELARRGGAGPGGKAVVVGTGAAAQAAVRYLAAKGARDWTVCGRSPERSRRLGERLGGAGAGLSELPALLADADVAVFAAAAERRLLDAPSAAAALSSRRGRLLVLIDLGVPRNVDPAAGRLEGVRLYDLDGLRRATRRAGAVRADDLRWAEELAREEAKAFA